MKVVHLNTHDCSGGAARAAYRLHTGLRRNGSDSSMLVLHRKSEDPTVSALRPECGLRRRLHRRLYRYWIERDFVRHLDARPSGLEPFTDDRTPYGSDVQRQLPNCDVAHLHWVRGFIDVRTFFEFSSVPVVWTLHDMNAFTGGCHYDIGCGRYLASCGKCPQLGSSEAEDLSRRVWKRKATAFEAVPPSRLHVVAPSRWLATEAERSTLLGRFPVSVIPNGLDTRMFAPRDDAAARRALGLPVDARVLLFVAQSASNDRKGFPLLAEALAELAGDLPNLVLLSVGKRAEIATEVPHLHLGSIDGDRLLSVIYSAAHVFVIPSLQDNFPNTVLESLACGTPVVGFETGGVPDMVRSGETGELVPAGDVRRLRMAMMQLLRDEGKRAAMAAECRRLAVKEYDLKRQAERYRRLYRNIMNESGRSV